MADWVEVRRLAADFQRLQASSTAHKLSERNCVELVSKLMERGLLEIVHTLDGKEYVTPSQLDQEIRDELTAHGGRINIVDLQQILNVDLSHIQSRVAEIVKHDRSLTLLHGELIERSYMHHLCEEINDLIQEAGQASLTDLSRNFNLPYNFLLEYVEAALDVQIRGYLDKSDTGIIYTESYVNRYRSRIRGLFHAITRPTAVSTIISEGGFQEKLFNTVLHQLISNEELSGNLRGRQEKAVYIPDVYTRNQKKWADSFLATNGYLEYDALSRIGINDPREYISQHYCTMSGSGELVQLSTCCVGKAVVTRVEGALEEMLGSGGWFDSMPLLPSPCTPSDAELLLRHVGSSQPNLHLFGGVATTKSFLRICCEHFKPMIVEKAQKVASNPLSINFLPRPAEEKTSSRKKGGGRKGGKSKGRGQEPDEDTVKSTCGLKFMAPEEIAEKLSADFPDCPEDFLLDIAANIESSLQDIFVEEVKECMSTMGQGTSASQLRKRHAELQDKVQGLWNMLHLFQKAIGLFEDDAAVQMNRYLLRTLCTDIFNHVLKYLADDNGVNLPSGNEFSLKERSSIIDALPASMKKKVTAVNAVLSGKNVADFFEMFEKLCMEDYCGVMLKKLDKKKERQLAFSHQQSLLESLRCEWEPSMVLHLVVVILFQQYTNCAIHVSGKFVPQVITHLCGHVQSDLYAKLSTFEKLIIEQRKLSAPNRKNATSVTVADESKVSQVSLENDAVVEGAEKGTATRPSNITQLEQELQGLVNDLKQSVSKPTKTTE